jgi:hypothetical protein
VAGRWVVVIVSSISGNKKGDWSSPSPHSDCAEAHG